MYSFLVLGIVPGTNIAISFQVWLAIMALLIVAAWRVKPRIGRLINEVVDEIFGTQQRQPLHASQLHLRAL
ncbi:MAG: hypothetical protein AAB436_02430 [Patescibacteria group bacterium]